MLFKNIAPPAQLSWSHYQELLSIKDINGIKRQLNKFNEHLLNKILSMNNLRYNDTDVALFDAFLERNWGIKPPKPPKYDAEGNEIKYLDGKDPVKEKNESTNEPVRKVPRMQDSANHVQSNGFKKNVHKNMNDKKNGNRPGFSN